MMKKRDHHAVAYMHKLRYHIDVTANRGVARLSTSGGQERNISSFFHYFLVFFLTHLGRPWLHHWLPTWDCLQNRFFTTVNGQLRIRCYGIPSLLMYSRLPLACYSATTSIGGLETDFAQSLSWLGCQWLALWLCLDSDVSDSLFDLGLEP